MSKKSKGIKFYGQAPRSTPVYPYSTPLESPANIAAATETQLPSIVAANDGQEKSEAATNAVKVVFPYHVWQKLMTYVNLCRDEISGLGYVRIANRNRIEVEDVFILKQKVTSVHVTPDPQSKADFMDYLVTENEAREQRGEPPKLARLQWHSHVGMKSYFSTEDLNTIQNCQTDWRISLVLNKSAECAIRLDTYTPFRQVFAAQIEVIYPRLPEESLRTIGEALKSLYPNGAPDSALAHIKQVAYRSPPPAPEDIVASCQKDISELVTYEYPSFAPHSLVSLITQT